MYEKKRNPYIKSFLSPLGIRIKELSNSTKLHGVSTNVVRYSMKQSYGSKEINYEDRIDFDGFYREGEENKSLANKVSWVSIPLESLINALNGIGAPDLMIEQFERNIKITISGINRAYFILKKDLETIGDTAKK